MDYQSVKSYEGQKVKITLLNNFWYRAKISSVTEHSVQFIEERGQTISVEPSAIMMIIPMVGSKTYFCKKCKTENRVPLGEIEFPLICFRCGTKVEGFL